MVRLIPTMLFALLLAGTAQAQLILCFSTDTSKSCVDETGSIVNFPELAPAALSALPEGVNRIIQQRAHSFDGRYIYFGQGSLIRADLQTGQIDSLLHAEHGAHYGVYYSGAKLSPRGDLLATTVVNGVAVEVVYGLLEEDIVLSTPELYDGYPVFWSNDGETFSVGPIIYKTEEENDWTRVPWAEAYLAEADSTFQLSSSLLDREVLYWITLSDTHTLLHRVERMSDVMPQVLFSTPNDRPQWPVAMIHLVAASPSGVFFKTTDTLFKVDESGYVSEINLPIALNKVKALSVYQLQ